MGQHHSSQASAGNHPPAAIHAAIAARNNQAVHLLGVASDGTVEAKGNGSVDAKGGNARNANWVVGHKGNDVVALQDQATKQFLRCDQNGTTCDGDGNDTSCHFKVTHHPNGAVSLKTQHGHVGFAPNGEPVPSSKVNANQREGQFLFEFPNKL